MIIHNPLHFHIWWFFACTAVLLIWLLALRINRRRVKAYENSGDPKDGILVFVEPVRWLFIIWGFSSVCRGFRQGGYRGQFRLFRWSGRAGSLLVLPDLMRKKRLKTKSARLLNYLNALSHQYPGQAVHLCGYSTGCYLILEALKKQTEISPTLGKVILLAGTISPDYDLDPLVDKNLSIFNYYSPADFFINGIGPFLFGCNNRRWSLACGMVGFHSPRIRQRKWSPGDILLGYLGDHFTIVSSAFVMRAIAPIMIGKIERRKEALDFGL
jgi:hypothetical protein